MAIIAVLAGLALYLGPVARLVVLWLCLGTPALTTLMLAEGLVMLVHGLNPVRAGAWFARSAPDEVDLPGRIVSLEFATAAVTVLLLVGTAPLWQPVMGATVPAWLIGLVAMRHAGQTAMSVLAGKRRLFAMLTALVDITVMLPLVAIIGRTLESVAFVSMTVTLILLILSVYAPIAPANKDEKEPLETDRWQVGGWLRELGRQLWRPLFVAIAGTAVIIPFAASLIVLASLSGPFMVLAITQPSPDPFRRFMRSWICTALGVVVVYHAGPALFRLVFPDAFGDGTWLHTLAWSSLAFVPMTIRAPHVAPSQRSKAVAAVLANILLVVLAIADGTHGFLLGVALSPLVRAVVSATIR